jgi:dTDP-N-acetylfucosamine:lipid II N-acetylfucosaminyltransferase
MSTSTNILHVMGWDKKFVPQFKSFINCHFDNGCHRFIIYSAPDDSPPPANSDSIVLKSFLKSATNVSKQLNRADKIIIHGLNSIHLVLLLALQPWLLKRCYWVIWGGDLYLHEAPLKDLRWQRNELLRRFVIKHIGHLVTYVSGDVELARRWYGATGIYHECLVYQSNLFIDRSTPESRHTTINILIGNSADPSNNHHDVFSQLAAEKDSDIHLYAPLSYGDVAYATATANEGVTIFGDKITPLMDFMPFDRYLELLGKIDIAIFAHKRQQGMGNAITLLGLGKKLYLRRDLSSWDFFQTLGVKVYDFMELDLTPIEPEVREDNIRKIREYFSTSRLLSQLEEIFS